jgi:hypothetical protein
MSNLTIPNALANGQPQDGNEVDANFDAIKAWADTHVVETAGTTFTGPVILAGNPATALVAAPKQYVDAHKPVCAFVRDTNLTVANGASGAVSFETETNDTEAWWTVGSPTVFTVPFSGIYAIALEIAMTTTVTVGSAEARVEALTAGLYLPNTMIAVVSGSRSANGGVVYLNAGSTFNVVAAVSGTGGPSLTFDSIKVVICRLATI